MGKHTIEVRTSRGDAGPSLFLSQELEAVIAEQYRADLPPLRVLQFIPVRTDVDPRSANIAYSYLTQVGAAAVLRLPSAEIPRVDIYREKFVSPVKTIATMYGWSLEEMEGAELAGIPLDREGADAARRAIAQAVSDIAISGHSATMLPGLMQNPNIPRTTVATGVGGYTFALKTADEQLRDLSAVAASVVNVSKGAYEPDSLIMPLEQYNIIADKPRATFSDETVLSYFKRTNPYIKNVNWVRELDGAGTAGVDAMVAYKNDPSMFAYWMVLGFQQRPAQEKNLSIEVVCRERTGGVIIPKPLSLAIYEGI